MSLPYLTADRVSARAEVDGMESVTGRLVDTWRDPMRRAKFHSDLDKIYETEKYGAYSADTVIIGGGVHAAIFAATEQARTGTCPLVVDDRGTGGVFALSRRAVFYLNSRNRPGPLGLPGTSGALNVIPNSLIQPSDLNGREYQTNAELAFVVRATHAMYSRVVMARAVEVLPSLGSRYRYRVRTEGVSARQVKADRVIIAVGLRAARLDRPRIGRDADVVMSFDEFVMRRDEFPLRGWKRVAVIGAQDSGDAVVKFLLGQGPVALGPASFDHVERIDWYGQSCGTKEEFEANSRSCNAGIGRHLPREYEPDYHYRVCATSARVIDIVPDTRTVGARVIYTYGDGSRVSDPYDHVVVCKGYEENPLSIDPSVDETLSPSALKANIPLRDEFVYDEDGTAIARHYVGTEIYKVGPCANLPVTDRERAATPVLARIPANSAAIFRYAGRTQRLAELLNPA